MWNYMNIRNLFSIVTMYVPIKYEQIVKLQRWMTIQSFIKKTIYLELINVIYSEKL